MGSGRRRLSGCHLKGRCSMNGGGIEMALTDEEARRWREYAITQRAEVIVHAGFWPLVPGWCEDLLRPDLTIPEYECVWPYPRPFPLPIWSRRLRLVRKNGKIV